MIRNIIKIDQEKCNGCGACAAACHEGAIEMIQGKARLVREDYCDGLGDCLPACPTGAISFEKREAPAYNQAAVLAAKEEKEISACSCPGSQLKTIHKENLDERDSFSQAINSQLSQWPVQIKLLPPNAPCFKDTDLLIAADCTAYAYGDFHNTFIRNRTTLIGCPKLDDVDYAHKLAAIIANNPIRSITVVRMEVPCCGGIEYAVKQALQASGKSIPLNVKTISAHGEILD